MYLALGYSSSKDLDSANGADARRQIPSEVAEPLGGTLDTAPVLREFFNTRDRAKRIIRAGSETI